ncbi:MAG: hypothetical protein ABIJ50_12700 [Pseudomonadota bacterium]
MKKRIIYTLLFLMAAGWLVKDDLPFLRMTLDPKNTQLVQGQVTRKFSKGVGLSRGGIKRHYFIEFQDLRRECSGVSRISQEDYSAINENDQIPLRRLNHLCLATIDIHSYTAPALQFIPAGMVLLIALFSIIPLIRDLMRNRTTPKPVP